MSEPLLTHLVRRTDVADGTVDYLFTLKQPPALAFRAGQFVTLAVAKDADGRDLRRSYSLASLPGPTLRLLLRLVPGGLGSQFFENLALGDAVAMTGPHGFFVLDEQHPGDIILAATGTGIAPVLPMMAELATRPVTGRREIYWGLRAQSDLFIVDEVEAACAAAGARLFTYLSRPTPGWSASRDASRPRCWTPCPAWSRPPSTWWATAP